MHTITQTQYDQFYHDGFIVVPSVFSHDEIQEMSDSIDRLIELGGKLSTTMEFEESLFVISQSNDVQQLRRVVWAGGLEPSLLSYGRSTGLTSVVADLLGSSYADHLLNQVHFKLPHDGVFYPMHTDSKHRRFGTPLWDDVNGKGSYVQSVIAIDDVTPDNGPLYFIPQKGRNHHVDLPYDEHTQTNHPLCNKADAVYPLLNKGDVVFFGPYVIHGSDPNESENPRRALINGFAAPDANKREYPGSGTGIRIPLIE